MLCDRCGKREATIQYIQVINGNKQELHLCSKCGKEVGVDDFAMPMSISNFFGDLFNDYSFPMLNSSSDIICEECNTSFDNFLNTGKMGCANCYKTFRKKLIPILKRIQGGTEYLGKAVVNEKEESVEHSKLKKDNFNTETENKIKSLENKLKKCIQEENYEEAAKIRDEIKKEKAKIDSKDENKIQQNKTDENKKDGANNNNNNNNNFDKGGNN